MIKKLGKFLGALLLFVVVAAGGLVAYVKLALPDVGPAPELKVEASPAQLARGAYLANNVSLCMDGHSDSRMAVGTTAAT